LLGDKLDRFAFKFFGKCPAWYSFHGYSVQVDKLAST
jgi:hypothetical protein